MNATRQSVTATKELEAALAAYRSASDAEAEDVAERRLAAADAAFEEAVRGALSALAGTRELAVLGRAMAARWPEGVPEAQSRQMQALLSALSAAALRDLGAPEKDAPPATPVHAMAADAHSYYDRATAADEAKMSAPLWGSRDPVDMARVCSGQAESHGIPKSVGL